VLISLIFTPKAVFPAWCASWWCYADKKNCNLPLIYRSSYLPNDEAHFFNLLILFYFIY